MKLIHLCLLLLVMGGPLFPAADAPSAAPDQGLELQQLESAVRLLMVKDGGYQAALKAYAKAARANPNSQYLRDQFALLRRVIKMQKALQTETNVEKWKSYARAVRAYYYTKGLYKAALALDSTVYEKAPDAQTATQKLESLLLVQKSNDAMALSRALKAQKPVRLQTLRPVVLAQHGQADAALAAIADLKIDPRQDPTPFVDFARIYWAAKKHEDAYASMRLFLEHTAPTERATSHHMLLGCPDFKSLHKKDAFQAMLATKSKVTQSGCTGGSSCSSCKLRDRCTVNR
jgi:tetratricopeptide (TPR) repeat protein